MSTPSKFAAFAIFFAACQVSVAHADEKQFAIPQVPLVPIAPGGQKPDIPQSAEAQKIMNDPGQIAAGKQLFQAMNCVGCHFNGGGGMGPPLMDNVWIYGGSMENIASSIAEGRPNGMPTFRGFIPDEQIWQLAAYVRSLSHPVSANASSGQQGK
jgi:cytochrome c oxidase cbb3-type subunit 3